MKENNLLKIFKIKKKLTSNKAYLLLTSDSIKERDDFFKPENKWILHSAYVGMAARRIAFKLNLDYDLAASLGYIHDIGRKFNHNNHPIEGYNYLSKLGYLNEARICLTHSFIDNDINLTAGGGPKDSKTYEFINDFLINNPVNIYDNIVQLCDLFCLENGFTTIEKRILDITNRKGIFDNSKEHLIKAIELKERIEELLGYSIYCLFPEINKDDLKNAEKDKEDILNLLEINKNKKLK